MPLRLLFSGSGCPCGQSSSVHAKLHVFIIAPLNCRLMNEDVHVPFIFHPRSNEVAFFSRFIVHATERLPHNGTFFRTIRHIRFVARVEKTVGGWFFFFYYWREPRDRDRKDRVIECIQSFRMYVNPVCENDIKDKREQRE